MFSCALSATCGELEQAVRTSEVSRNSNRGKQEENSMSTAFQAGVNLAKISVGTGILALPYATVNSGGLVLSPILNAIIAVLNGACNAMHINHIFHILASYPLTPPHTHYFISLQHD